MANISRSSVVLETDADPAPLREIDADTPFRILILGDFSGRKNRGLHAGLDGLRPAAVDLDNFDDVMQAMQPSLRLPGAQLRFRELDDFHPDHIYRDTELFQKLANLEYAPATVTPVAPIPAGPDLLSSILEQEEEPSSAKAEDANDLAAFIKKVMTPHLEERVDPNKKAWSARVDAVVAEQMRAILHHADFQALEAAWRGAWLLVHGLGDDVKIYLCDATLDELLADAAALDKVLTAPRDPWAVVVGTFAFAEGDEDAQRLQTLGRLMRKAGAPFLAEGQPPSGDPTPESWLQLRQSPIAQWIGLALPRFLLRMPYGKESSEVESFPFEEMPQSVHTDYLWGNPAFCCAYLIGQSFQTNGWDLQPGTHRRVTGLPLHVYESDGEQVAKPCAEIFMSEKEADFLMEHGYMPLASMKEQDSVLLVRFQSMADPPTALAGRWS